MKTACCNYEFDSDCPVTWNPGNRVVQCHNCGTVYHAVNPEWEALENKPHLVPAILQRHVCLSCGGSGLVDVDAKTPWGDSIQLPCPSCCNSPFWDCTAIGAAWRYNASLEKWFPITAEELGKLKREVESLRSQIAEQKDGSKYEQH